MDRRRNAWVLLVAALALTLGAWSDLRSDGFVSVGGFAVAGNTVNVSVVNDSDTDENVLVTVRVQQKQKWYEASARVHIPAGSTVVAPIVVGTITDDIDPLDVNVALHPI